MTMLDLLDKVNRGNSQRLHSALRQSVSKAIIHDLAGSSDSSLSQPVVSSTLCDPCFIEPIKGIQQIKRGIVVEFP